MKKITLSVVLAIVLLASLALTASAQANRTYFTGVEYDCFTGMGSEPRMEGNVMHMRDVFHVNVNVSDEPEFNGINTTVAAAEFNMKTGGAVIRGTWSFEPEGIAGTWEGNWIFTGNKGKGAAQAVGHGTGALTGKTIFLKLYDDPNPDYNKLVEMCAGIGDPEGIGLFEGYILEP